jgi:hypothetical protein
MLHKMRLQSRKMVKQVVQCSLLDLKVSELSSETMGPRLCLYFSGDEATLAKVCHSSLLCGRSLQ